MAPMGEEVVDPGRTIPRAIVLALGGTVVVYALVGLVVVLVLGAGATDSTAPLVDVLVAAGASTWAPVIRIAAAAASLGALLALLTGIGRTALAMAREGDVPRFLAKIDRRHQVPQRAALAIALIAVPIVPLADPRGAPALSPFRVLRYY
ncbi:amino acid permease, partial [Enterococcus faecium]|uniref:amino acid permease n=1 Tax=Enterococcus faecium TaxID=1352 RepID=UPI0030C8BDD5